MSEASAAYGFGTISHPGTSVIQIVNQVQLTRIRCCNTDQSMHTFGYSSRNGSAGEAIARRRWDQISSLIWRRAQYLGITVLPKGVR